MTSYRALPVPSEYPRFAAGCSHHGNGLFQFTGVMRCHDRTAETTTADRNGRRADPLDKYAALEQTTGRETLYILPTYSAMLDIREILTGRKIL